MLKEFQKAFEKAGKILHKTDVNSPVQRSLYFHPSQDGSNKIENYISINKINNPYPKEIYNAINPCYLHSFGYYFQPEDRWITVVWCITDLAGSVQFIKLVNPSYKREYAYHLIKRSLSITSDKVLIVGITGKAGAGKDTVANMILQYFINNAHVYERCNYTDGDYIFTPLYVSGKLNNHVTIHILTFAAELKRMCTKLLNTDKEFFWVNKDRPVIVNDKATTPRFILQQFGTEVARTLSPDCWVNILKQEVHKIRASRPGIHLILIPDTRFDNEVKWIKDEGGIVINMQRTEVAQHSHSSENSITYQPNYTIENNDTLNRLRIQVNQLITEIFSKFNI
jgi:hypothetical protein